MCMLFLKVLKKVIFPVILVIFWVLPEEEIMISILIDGQRKRGIENFTYYMNSFLTYCAKFVIYDCDSEDCVKKRIWFSR